MTTPQPVSNVTIMRSFLRSKSYQPIRAKYRLNYNCITFLLGCYLYSVFIDHSFSANKIYRFVTYYQHHLVVRYIGQLVDCNLLASTGRKYSITKLGCSAVAEISNNNDNNLYMFCSKYSIEL